MFSGELGILIGNGTVDILVRASNTEPFLKHSVISIQYFAVTNFGKVAFNCEFQHVLSKFRQLSLRSLSTTQDEFPSFSHALVQRDPLNHRGKIGNEVLHHHPTHALLVVSVLFRLIRNNMSYA